MNSMIDYIRQINKASVSLNSEWLDRLRFVDVGADSVAVTPEIVFSERTIPTWSESQLEPPVTMVSQQPDNANEETARVTRLDRVDDPIQERPQDSPEKSGDVQVVSVPEASVLDNAFFEHYTCDVHSGTLVNPVPSPEGIEPAKHLQPPETESRPVHTPQPVASPAQSQPVLPVVESGGLLDSPAILDSIVRPTIVPLQPMTTPDTTDLQPVAGPPQTGVAESGLSAPTVEIPENQGAMPDLAESDSGERSADQNISANDTGTQLLPVSLLPRFTPSGGERNVAFPSDKRAEDFQYSRTKRQNLVDSIVDQIEQRFPHPAPATVMLVAANREINVDSAASRIATCLAAREGGKILLVDANLRSRQLTSILGLDNDPGITGAFLRNEPAVDCACPTDNPRLEVMGAGSRELADHMQNIKSARNTNNSLKQKYQYTIVSGGISGDPLTDAWAGIVDGIYLIVDMDESDRDCVTSSVENFRKIGARIVGCIATRA